MVVGETRCNFQRNKRNASEKKDNLMKKKKIRKEDKEKLAFEVTIS